VGFGIPVSLCISVVEIGLPELEIVSKIIIILSRFIIFSFTKNYSYYTINIEFDAIYIFGEILWME
jgi:hypothetical protein|tara:strand:- start:2153 stop:2350 length:198 start_codon:yes stop_codon:yes gene_type:complete